MRDDSLHSNVRGARGSKLNKSLGSIVCLGCSHAISNFESHIILGSWVISRFSAGCSNKVVIKFQAWFDLFPPWISLASALNESELLSTVTIRLVYAFPFVPIPSSLPFSSSIDVCERICFGIVYRQHTPKEEQRILHHILVHTACFFRTFASNISFRSSGFKLSFLADPLTYVERAKGEGCHPS